MDEAGNETQNDAADEEEDAVAKVPVMNAELELEDAVAKVPVINAELELEMHDVEDPNLTGKQPNLAQVVVGDAQKPTKKKKVHFVDITRMQLRQRKH